MDNSLASFAGQAFSSSPTVPDAEISVSGVSLTIGGPDYSVENIHNVPTQSVTLALGQVALEMIALPSGLTVPSLLGDVTVNADSNLVQSGVSVTTTLQSHEFGVLTTFPSGVTVNTALGNVAARTDKTHEVTGVSLSTTLGQVIAEVAPTLASLPLTMILGEETLFLNANVPVTTLPVTATLGQVIAEVVVGPQQLTATSAVGQVVIALAVPVQGVVVTSGLGQANSFTWAVVDDTTSAGSSWTDVSNSGGGSSWDPVDTSNAGGESPPWNEV
tara:strand:+ start:691 stop:1512 length:822 start_codon:yes stop_codon:yes gene_type:complete